MKRMALAGVVAVMASACGQAPTESAPAPSSAPAAAATADTVQTRLGALNFERGYPTAETTRKLFDEIDYQRAVQAYLWAYPAVSFESIRVATERDFNGGLNAMFIADKFADAQSIFLTANDTTIYAYTNVDLGKSGPIVVDVPPGRIVGLIDDFWQRSLADVGLPGPYGDKGGKFLMLPPGYKGDVPKDGYQVLHGTMNNYNIMVRGIVSSMEDAPAAVETRQEASGLSVERTQQPEGDDLHVVLRQEDRHAPARGPRILGAPVQRHQQQPGSRARPFLHGDAQAARHREGQAVQPRRAATRHPRGCGAHRRCDGPNNAVRR